MRLKNGLRIMRDKTSPFIPLQEGDSMQFYKSFPLFEGARGRNLIANFTTKIFQPIFTTKPTGSGTGLGLSLSYDIVKAHGGDTKVQSKEGEGSLFIIQLPNIKIQ